jgi:hypothetical protein
MDGDIGADHAVVIDLDTRMQDGVVADPYIIAQIDLRVDLDLVADHHPLTQIGKSAYKDLFAQFRRLGNIGRLLDAGQLLCFYLLVFRQQAGKSGIGIGTRINVAVTGCFSSSVSLTIITEAPVV